MNATNRFGRNSYRQECLQGGKTNRLYKFTKQLPEDPTPNWFRNVNSLRQDATSDDEIRTTLRATSGGCYSICNWFAVPSTPTDRTGGVFIP
jgi:hypothetical protein